MPSADARRGRPRLDLYLSADRALYIGGVPKPVKHLINGITIAQVRRHAALLADPKFGSRTCDAEYCAPLLVSGAELDAARRRVRMTSGRAAQAT